jgi:paraquat-inducible protein B
MSSKGNPAAIGAFIVGGILLITLAIFVFSSDSLFSKNQRFIVVFTESINGLKVGAPIKLYGVQIGHVTEISVERDKEKNITLIPVVFEVNAQHISQYVNTQVKNWDVSEIDKLINSGLRMQLQLGSLLTGQLFIEALFLPDIPIALHGHSKNLKEIPSIPSSSAEIQKTLRNLLESSKTVDLKTLFNNLQEVVGNIAKITGSEQTQSTLSALNKGMLDLQQIMSTLKGSTNLISHDLQKTIEHADQLISNVNTQTDSLFKDTRHIVQTGESTLENLNSALSSVKTVIDNNSPISQDLQTALQELARAARSTRVMMNYLEQHPDALLYGKDSEQGGRR